MTLPQPFRSLILPTLLSAAIWLLGMNSELTERFYSRGIYPPLSAGLRWISGSFHFPAGDLLYLILILLLLLSLFRFCRRSWQARSDRTYLLKGLLGLLHYILWLYIAFKILWGLNYSRPSIAHNLGISNQSYSAAQLTVLARQLIAETNRTAAKMQKQKARRIYTLQELENGAVLAYQQLATKNPIFLYQNPVLKPVLFPAMITKIGLEGYYCPISAEANVNMALPPVSLPFVSSHEIAHQMGIAREDEANLAAYLACLNSTDLNFRYAGLYAVLRNVLFEVRLIAPEELKALRALINTKTLADYETEREFWLQYNTELSAYMGTALDQFLKINNQTKGIASYQDIVLWVYNLQLQQDPTLFPAFENSTGYRHKNQ